MDYLHEKTIVISEAHLDSFGHVNNARYLELLEQARWDLITERGHGIDVIRRTRSGPTILEINIRFLRELGPVSYTHLRAHETPEHLVCRLLLEKKKKTDNKTS